MKYVKLVGAESVSEAAREFSLAADSLCQNLQWLHDELRGIQEEFRALREELVIQRQMVEGHIKLMEVS